MAGHPNEIPTRHAIAQRIFVGAEVIYWSLFLSFWAVVIIVVVTSGYFMATDWAEKRHKALHSFGDYMGAIRAGLEDAEYKADLAGRVQDFLQYPSCDLPLKRGSGNVVSCYLTLDQPVRLYPGADAGTFITIPVGSALKVALPIPIKGDYANAQTLTLNGEAIMTGAITANACGAAQKCLVTVDGLNTAGRKPTEAPVPAAAPSFDGAYGCTKDAGDNPEDHIIRLEQKTKSVRESMKYTPPLACEFSFKDGTFGPLVTRETCSLPLPTTNVYQRVEYEDDTVLFGFFETSSSGPLTPEQRARMQRFNMKTGVMQASNGDRFQCRLMAPK
jgi:hypothetical protein